MKFSIPRGDSRVEWKIPSLTNENCEQFSNYKLPRALAPKSTLQMSLEGTRSPLI